MIRRLLLLVGLAILVSTLAPAADEPANPGDEPPLRLKKKKKADANPTGAEEKKAEEKKPEAKKPEEKKEQAKEEMPGEITRDGEPIDPGEDEKEVLERVARNMKAVEERIVNKELNEGTRQLQEDIVKDLESLIRSSEGGGGGGEGGGGGDDQNDPQNQQGQKGGQQGQKSGQKGQKGNQQGKKGQQQGQQGQQGQKGGEKGQQGQKSGQQGQQGQKGSQQGQKGGQQGQKGGQEGNEKQQGMGGGNPGAGNGKDEPPQPNREGEVFKDPWGHLPETLRQQMHAYASREKYMDKHHDLIKQYYKTIAAQGRKKEN